MREARTALPYGSHSQGDRLNHSDSGAFLVGDALLSQDGFQWEGF